jgi:hypothetical protein
MVSNVDEGSFQLTENPFFIFSVLKPGLLVRQLLEAKYILVQAQVYDGPHTLLILAF